MRSSNAVNARLKVTVVLTIMVLLAFTTIRTSPLSLGVGPGSALSKTTPKQRHLSIREIVYIVPPLWQPPLEERACNETGIAAIDEFPLIGFHGPHQNRPPPVL